MRLMHFVQRYPPALGGAEAYFARLSQWHTRRGDSVDVVTTTACDLAAFWRAGTRELGAGTTQQDGVRVHRFRMLRAPGRRWGLKTLSLFPHRAWQCWTLPCNPVSFPMRAFVDRWTGPLDAVHASAFPYAWVLMCARRLARRHGVPFFLTPFLHTGDPANPADSTRRAYLQPPLAWLLREADGIFVQTPSEHDAVAALGVPASRIHLQGMGVDPRECTGGNRARARSTWQVPGDVPVVGILANNSIEKGTVDLLHALARLWRDGVNARLVITGPDMPNWLRAWHHFAQYAPDLARHVTRLGAVDDAAKRDFFAGIDLFAMPSRSDSFGLVFLEAWANGIPTLGYRAGGVPDVIRHDVDGVLVPCGDVNGLAKALKRLIADALLRHALGTAGRARLARDFCWEDKFRIVNVALRQAVEQRTMTRCA